MNDRFCKICKISKPIDKFGLKNKQTGSRRHQCNSCLYLKHIETHKKNINSDIRKKWKSDNRELNNAKTKARYETNPEKKLIKNREWISKNLEKHKELQHKNYLENKECYRAKDKRWCKNHPEYIRYKQSLRRARVQRATFKELKKDIREIYNNCPEGCHVDHIVPLNHKDVCGLHVPWNLQYLTAEENLRKSNRYGF